MPDAGAAVSPLDELLRLMVRSGASDLHIKVGSPPGLRITGVLSPLPGRPQLTAEDTQALVCEVLGDEGHDQLVSSGDFECAHSVPGLGRFRVNAMLQRGSLGMVLRRIPVEVPDIDDLGLPPVLKELALQHHGLVLITGPSACGKSTTLAAMIDYRNRTSADHILTLEDPVEFVHADKSCYVNQREVGADTPSFRDGLRQALRQDPDVIMVGELNDLETIATALTAAETGHLVLGALHTVGAVHTVERLIDLFPPEQQNQVRIQLSDVLQGVVSQILLPRTTGGRVPAFEIMVGTDPVRHYIREGNTGMLGNLLRTGASHGMVELGANLAELVRQGAVDPEDALGRSPAPEELRAALGESPVAHAGATPSPAMAAGIEAIDALKAAVGQ
ncbi:MAG: type IV pilus twitching motility protein PilT [Planctomycetota bacterium]|jgi:twitching motility protein PilT